MCKCDSGDVNRKSTTEGEDLCNREDQPTRPPCETANPLQAEENMHRAPPTAGCKMQNITAQNLIDKPCVRHRDSPGSSRLPVCRVFTSNYPSLCWTPSDLPSLRCVDCTSGGWGDWVHTEMARGSSLPCKHCPSCIATWAVGGCRRGRQKMGTSGTR